MPMLTFFVYLAVNWWATWYPGAEPGGGGYVAQRIFCARDEKHSLLATLWFNVAHYAVRPWPWVLTALASLVLYPDLVDKESGFVKTIVDPLVFPVALRGVMIAAFAAAYMSSVGTQLNWGASYLVNDFYRRFLVRGASERHYVRAGQAATLVVMAASCVVTWYQESIAGAWTFLIAVGAGTGGVFILRWFWWRINAWSEIAAMASSFLLAVALLVLQRAGLSPSPHITLVATVLITTVVWLAATFLTRPTDPETLARFYRLVRPAGPGWTTVRTACGGLPPADDLRAALLGMASSSVVVYSALFGTGHVLMGHVSAAVVSSVILIISLTVMIRAMVRLMR
jgi:solute:Na+ symporter, SSS family